jgi:hypothetical protein
MAEKPGMTVDRASVRARLGGGQALIIKKTHMVGIFW